MKSTEIVLTSQEILDYLNSSINSFVADPPDSDHQEGYHAAILEVHKVLTGGYAK